MQSRRVKLMLSLIGENARFFVRAAIGAVFTVMIRLITPLLMGETVDAIIGTRPLNAPKFIVSIFESIGGREYMVGHLWIVALIMISLSLVQALFMYVRGKSTSQGAEQAALTLRNRLYVHLSKLSYNYHVKAETGDLIQRCTSDVETTRRFLAGQLVEAIASIVLIVVALVVLFGRNLKLSLYSSIVILPLFLFALIFFKLVIKHFKETDEAEGKMSAVLQENLTGVRVVRAFGRQHFEAEKFEEKSEDLRKKSDVQVKLLAFYWSASDLLTMVQIGITLLVGIVMTTRGEITIGTLTIFLSYIGSILWPVRQLGRILSDAGKSLVSLERIDEILRQPVEQDAENPTKPQLTGDVVFDNVSFYYEEARPVLTDISFTARAGETVAILGATGCGKSTLVHLLQRLYEPRGGRITIGGHRLERIEKHYLRSRIGLVLQEPFLYSKTIKENVGIARKDAPEDEIFAAANVAQADEFIKESVKGYDTLVGERGVTLSGGQKQRIAIARTLMKENDILIFDDSLSAVDTQTDAAIRRALRERKKGVTTFIISHRITTLSEADKILVMEGGRVVQQGTHQELIREPGLYKRIFDIQSAIEDELGEDEREIG